MFVFGSLSFSFSLDVNSCFSTEFVNTGPEGNQNIHP